MSVIWSIEKSRWERESCPLSGIEKRLLLGGYESIKVMLDTIRNTTVVRCREAVLFSEGPLSEARLYTHVPIIIEFILYTFPTTNMCAFIHDCTCDLRVEVIKRHNSIIFILLSLDQSLLSTPHPFEGLTQLTVFRVSRFSQ